MTLIAAWVRKNANLRELVLASDSRLSGGESWDTCPKIVALPRPATAVAMSGDATAAYAFLLHAINTCHLMDGHASGRADIGYLANKLRALYAENRAHVFDLPAGQQKPDRVALNVVLVGWSWRNLCFEGYSFKYDKNGDLQMHRLHQLEDRAWGSFYLAGDASVSARRQLWKLIRERQFTLPKPKEDPESARIASGTFLNWEPLEVLRQTIANPSNRTVGGAPQLLKIYQYGECESFVWRDSSGDYFGGRPVRHGERFDRRIASMDGTDLVIQMSDGALPPPP